jgi:hypothetical protein
MQLQQFQSNIYDSSVLSYLKSAERYDQDIGVHVDAGRLGELHYAGCPKLLSFILKNYHTVGAQTICVNTVFTAVSYLSFEIFIQYAL